jgi:hypothetical protein
MRERHGSNSTPESNRGNHVTEATLCQVSARSAEEKRRDWVQLAIIEALPLYAMLVGQG